MSTRTPLSSAQISAAEDYIGKITTLPIEDVLEDLRQGKFAATAAVARLNTPAQKAYWNRLKEGGVISVFLSLLKRCENETLTDVLGEGSAGEEYIDEPAYWVSILVNSVLPDDPSRSVSIDQFNSSPYCMEIAENIEPLLKCMCDDTKRELFKSTDYWYETMSFYPMMMMNVVMQNPNALDVLLQYEGFLDMRFAELVVALPDSVPRERIAIDRQPTLASFWSAGVIILQID